MHGVAGSAGGCLSGVPVVSPCWMKKAYSAGLQSSSPEYFYSNLLYYCSVTILSALCVLPRRLRQ